MEKMFEKSGEISVWSSDEVKIPLVLKKIEEKTDGNAEKRRFIPIAAMNLFALNFSIVHEKTAVSKIEVKIVKIKLRQNDFVIEKKRKNKKAAKLTIPSKKRAKVPVNSENSAPSEHKTSGQQNEIIFNINTPYKTLR